MNSTDPAASRFETVVDEIGIEIGVYNEWRLKAVYEPVFALSGKTFHAVAARGSMRAVVYGHDIDLDLFRSAVEPGSRRRIAGIEALLCLRNLAQTFVPDLKLILDLDLGVAVPPVRLRAGARVLRAEIARLDLDPTDVFVCLSRLERRDRTALQNAAAALCAAGIGVAVVESGEGIADLAGSFADLITIDAGWFAAVARRPETVQLLVALVRSYRAHGARVLIEGIESSEHLAIAVDCGADWLCGPLLAPAALAGSIFPEEPVDLDALLDEPRVIPLFR